MPSKEQEKKNYYTSSIVSKRLSSQSPLRLIVNNNPNNKPQYYFSINNRRYLGNKYKLNEFIKNTIEKECEYFETFADLFAGTGSVASLFQDKHLIVNDILFSNYVCHQTWFGTEKYSKNKIISYINKYNQTLVQTDNYVSKNFADTYFSKKNCKKIGYIREDIDNNFKNGNLNFREQCILITSLLYAMIKSLTPVVTTMHTGKMENLIKILYWAFR